ncbi:MAG: permease [Chitinophagaceae bacterium]|nr:permease [Chitinophagaceae bacterium]
MDGFTLTYSLKAIRLQMRRLKARQLTSQLKIAGMTMKEIDVDRKHLRKIILMMPHIYDGINVIFASRPLTIINMINPKRSPEEEYIVSESPEITVGENTSWIKQFALAFPALQNKNYKAYFSGQLVSLIGTWLQIVSQGWLVLQLTNSALQIGIIAALSTLPSLFLTLFGGVIVDQFPKRKILLVTQGASMILAFTLGILTLTGLVSVWMIGVVAFLLGIVTAIDSPARQVFVSEIVTKEQLPSAIALNSGIFNAARVIGPSVAGVLIALIGTGGAFIVNGFSYVAVLLALLWMKVEFPMEQKKLHAIQAIKEGLHYSFSHPIIRTLIIFTGVSSVFGWSYTTVMPLIAQNTFHLGAAGLGYLYAATGLGSLLATLLIATFSKKISPEIFIIGGSILFAMSLILFSYTDHLLTGMILLFLSGLGLLSQFAMMNTVIQSLVTSEFKGRVISIYILMFIGLTPVGNLGAGWLAEHAGTNVTLRTGAVVILIFSMGILYYRNSIRTAYHIYKKREQR